MSSKIQSLVKQDKDGTSDELAARLKQGKDYFKLL
jgi:hypothetical protein